MTKSATSSSDQKYSNLANCRFNRCRVCLALHSPQPQTAHPQTAHSAFTDRLMHIAQSWQYTAMLAEIPIPIRLAIPV